MNRLLIVAAMCLGCVVGSFADEASMKDMKDMVQSVNISDIRTFGTEALVKKTPLQTDKLVFNTYFLAQRQTLALHKHATADELFFVVAGDGQFTVGENKTLVSAGSAVYGPADVMHGIVNSGDTNMTVISVQAPTPVKTEWAQNASVICPICGQENIVTTNAKVGDIYVCPRCHQKFVLSKDKDGKWKATKI